MQEHHFSYKITRCSQLCKSSYTDCWQTHLNCWNSIRAINRSKPKATQKAVVQHNCTGSPCNPCWVRSCSLLPTTITMSDVLLMHALKQHQLVYACKPRAQPFVLLLGRCMFWELFVATVLATHVDAYLLIGRDAMSMFNSHICLSTEQAGEAC
jgi:hypothetical protein